MGGPVSVCLVWNAASAFGGAGARLCVFDVMMSPTSATRTCTHACAQTQRRRRRPVGYLWWVTEDSACACLPRWRRATALRALYYCAYFHTSRRTFVRLHRRRRLCAATSAAHMQSRFLCVVLFSQRLRNPIIWNILFV